MATHHIIALTALVILAQYGPQAPVQRPPLGPYPGGQLPSWVPRALPPGSPGTTIPNPTPIIVQPAARS